MQVNEKQTQRPALRSCQSNMSVCWLNFLSWNRDARMLNSFELSISSKKYNIELNVD